MTGGGAASRGVTVGGERGARMWGEGGEGVDAGAEGGGGGVGCAHVTSGRYEDVHV